MFRRILTAGDLDFLAQRNRDSPEWHEDKQ
jgi:hypothetical protein